MPSRFEALRERLLRAGIGPRRAERYLSELADHLADLTAEEQDAGPAVGAEARAFGRLGDLESLAEMMTARPELRSWSARRPWAAYFLGPSVALTAGLALSATLMVAMVEAFRPAGGGAPVLPVWFPEFATALTIGAPRFMPILLGWAFAAYAVHRRTSAHWPVLGLATLAVFGGAVGFSLALPSSAGPGELGIYLAILPPYDHLGLAGIRIAANLALMVIPYLAARPRDIGIA